MSNGVKKSEEKRKNTLVQIACADIELKAKIKEGEKILKEMTEGKSLLEFDLYNAEISIKLEDNQVDKESGDRYLNGVKISIKGKTEKPKANRKSKAKEDDDLTH